MDLSAVFSHAPTPVAADWSVRTGRIPDTPVEFTPDEVVRFATSRGAGLTVKEVDSLLGAGNPAALEALLSAEDPAIVGPTLASQAVSHETRVQRLADCPTSEEFEPARSLVADVGALEELSRASALRCISIGRLGRLLLDGASVDELMSESDFDVAVFRGRGSATAEVDELVAVLQRAVAQDIDPLYWDFKSAPVQEAAYRVLAGLVTDGGEWDDVRGEAVCRLTSKLQQVGFCRLDTASARLPIPTQDQLGMDDTEVYSWWLSSCWSALFPLNAEEAGRHQPYLLEGYLMEGTVESVQYLVSLHSRRGRGTLVFPEDRLGLRKSLIEWLRSLDPLESDIPRIEDVLGPMMGKDSEIQEILAGHIWSRWEAGLWPVAHLGWGSRLKKELPRMWEKFLREKSTQFPVSELVDAHSTQTTDRLLANQILAGMFERGDAAAGAAKLLHPRRELLPDSTWSTGFRPLLELALSHPDGLKAFPWTRQMVESIASRDEDLASRLVGMWVRLFVNGEAPSPAPRAVANWGSPEDISLCLGALTGGQLDQFIQSVIRNHSEGAASVAALVEDSLGSNLLAWGLLENLSRDWDGSFLELIATAKSLADG